MAELAQTLTDNNQTFVDTFQQSFDKLFTVFSEQNKKTHEDFLAANTNAKANSSGRASLGNAPTFSGRDNDALEFLEQFCYFADFHNWDEKQRLSAFAISLTGLARTWLFTLDKKYSTFTELANLFKERFISKSDDWILRQELNSRKQLMQESVAEYSSDILKRCQRLNIPKQEQLHFFIQGLLPDIRDYVILSQPTSIDKSIIAKIRSTVKSNNSLGINAQDIADLKKGYVRSY